MEVIKNISKACTSMCKRKGYEPGCVVTTCCFDRARREISREVHAPIERCREEVCHPSSWIILCAYGCHWVRGSITLWATGWCDPGHHQCGPNGKDHAASQQRQEPATTTARKKKRVRQRTNVEPIPVSCESRRPPLYVFFVLKEGPSSNRCNAPSTMPVAARV